MKLKRILREVDKRLYTSTRYLNLFHRQPNSLLRYTRNIYSQVGDDGIIEYIFNKIGVKKGFFVEFGAFDGIGLSNTYHLFEKGWDGALIEADKEAFKTLRKNYEGKNNVVCIHEFVTYDENDTRGMTFDAIADRYFPDKHIDFLSIDVDGMDYRVFESLRRKPTVVTVEGGWAWHPLFNEKVPDDISCHNLQQPIAVMCEAGKEKGYEPICFNQNLYFIKKDLFFHFSHIRNDPISLWKDYWFNMNYDYRRWVKTERKKEIIRKIEGKEFLYIFFNKRRL